MNPSVLVLFLSLFVCSLKSHGQTHTSHAGELVVSGANANLQPVDPYRTERVQSLRPKEIARKQAQTLAQALSDEKGIDSQSICAFCGAKRISINGLRGEHTTLLTDGLQLQSSVTTPYGVDAVPLVGIDHIDIYRGTGNALTRPESIAGAVDVVTLDPLTTQGQISAGHSMDQQWQTSALGSFRLSPKLGILIAASRGELPPVDMDHNGLSELPRQTLGSWTAKILQRPNKAHQWGIRLSGATLTSTGGTMQKLRLTEAVRDPEPKQESNYFSGGDVRGRFIGNDRWITDSILVQRNEVASNYRWNIDDSASLKFDLGMSVQQMQAVYSHGYDYQNKDQIVASRLEYTRALNEEHVVVVGSDLRHERMGSNSKKLYEQDLLKKDNFHHQSHGFYGQDTWTINSHNELVAALRIDDLSTQWHDYDKSMHRTAVAPRISYKHKHNDILTSRASYGVGYRAPLSLYESQHGTYHGGFDLALNDLERAHALTYSLTGQRLNDFFEAAVHATYLENMAYGQDLLNQEDPITFRNSSDPYWVYVYDFSYGRRIYSFWSLEGRLEHFDYPSGYKSRLPVAAIEDRGTVLSNFERNRWSFTQKVTLIGERNLHAYGYSNHYNKAHTNEDQSSIDYGVTTMDQPKNQRAPFYWLLDVTADYKVTEDWTMGMAVLNVFDYSQTKDSESPGYFQLHDSHYHLDNRHIWGPLRGRQIFANLRGTF